MLEIDINERAQGELYKHNPRALPGEPVNLPDWGKYLLRLQRNLFGRTGYIYALRDIKPTVPLGTEPPKRAKFICVSSQIAVAGANGQADRADLILREFDDDRHILVPTNKISPETWREERLAELREAIKFDGTPDVICFGEFAYPPPPLTEELGGDAEAWRNYQTEIAAFDKEAQRLASECGAFLFLGSYHCTKTFSNVGIIYPWSGAEAITSPRSRPSDSASMQLPVRYRKRFPARSVGERIRIPGGRDLDVYHLPIGRIAVLICSDVVDLNQFMAIARANLDPVAPLDYILVPSFNRTSDTTHGDPMESMCNELSFLASTTVIAVNANSHLPSFPTTAIFCCGSDAQHLTKAELDVDSDSISMVSQKAESFEHPMSNRKFTLHAFGLSIDAMNTLRSVRARIQKTESPVIGVATEGVI